MNMKGLQQFHVLTIWFPGDATILGDPETLEDGV